MSERLAEQSHLRTSANQSRLQQCHRQERCEMQQFALQNIAFGARAPEQIPSQDREVNQLPDAGRKTQKLRPPSNRNPFLRMVKITPLGRFQHRNICAQLPQAKAHARSLMPPPITTTFFVNPVGINSYQTLA
jgi:hypothetical protein